MVFGKQVVYILCYRFICLSVQRLNYTIGKVFAAVFVCCVVFSLNFGAHAHTPITNILIGRIYICVSMKTAIEYE